MQQVSLRLGGQTDLNIVYGLCFLTFFPTFFKSSLSAYWIRVFKSISKVSFRLKSNWNVRVKLASYKLYSIEISGIKFTKATFDAVVWISA